MDQYIVKFKNNKGVETTFTNFAESADEAKDKTVLMFGCESADISTAYPVDHTEDGLIEKAV